MDILQLSNYLDDLLDIHNIQDSSTAFNGLQVQNRGAIRKVGLAVDICNATIIMAVEKDCQMLFVHHGLFWGGSAPVRGKLYEKLSTLMRHNIGLYSSHIPLDVHPVVGNSRTLADCVGLQRMEPFGEYHGQKIGFKGSLDNISAVDLGRLLESRLGTKVKIIGDGKVQTIGLVTGGAGDIIDQAVKEGLDCYLTGEASNHHFHEAIEGGCVMILAGHYATETGGVKAIGQHIQEKFGIESVFLDYPTGL